MSNEYEYGEGTEADIKAEAEIEVPQIDVSKEETITLTAAQLNALINKSFTEGVQKAGTLVQAEEPQIEFDPSVDKFVWIENMSSSQANFKSDKGKFKASPNGYVGSVIQVPELLKADPYLQQIARRKNKSFIRFVGPNEDIMALQENLKDMLEDDQDEIQKMLTAEAENTSRYIDGIPDEGEQGVSISAGEIWNTSSNKTETVAATPQREQEFTSPILDDSVLAEKVISND